MTGPILQHVWRRGNEGCVTLYITLIVSLFWWANESIHVPMRNQHTVRVLYYANVEKIVSLFVLRVAGGDLHWGIPHEILPVRVWPWLKLIMNILPVRSCEKKVLNNVCFFYCFKYNSWAITIDIIFFSWGHFSLYSVGKSIRAGGCPIHVHSRCVFLFLSFSQVVFVVLAKR